MYYVITRRKHAWNVAVTGLSRSICGGCWSRRIWKGADYREQHEDRGSDLHAAIEKTLREKAAKRGLANVRAQGKEFAKAKPAYWIVRGSLEEPAQDLIKLATKRLGYPPQGVYYAGASIAINSGPKVVAICMQGLQRTKQ